MTAATVQARMILAGIHPESTGECRDSRGVSYHYISLPGTKEAYKVDKLDSIDFHKNVEDSDEGNMGYLRGFIFGESQTPHYWLEKALDKQYSPPWYEVAKKAGYFRNLKSAAEKAHGDRVAGGQSTQRNSPQGKFKMVVLVCWDTEIAPHAKKDKKQFEKRASEFTTKYREIFLDKDFGEGIRTVGGWVSELKRDLTSAKTASWIAEYRDDPNYNEVSSQEEIKGKMQSAGCLLAEV